MAMSRGLEIMQVFFTVFLFTSDRAQEKVIDLCRVLADSGMIKLYVNHRLQDPNGTARR